MTKYFFIAVFSIFVFGAGLQSCNKSTCPTYKTSGPTKGIKKKIKKSRAAYSVKDKKKKNKRGKAIPGID